LELVHSPTSSYVWAWRFWKFLIDLNFVVYESLRIHQYWFVFMSRLASELGRVKIKCRRFGLFRKKQKKRVTEDERYISRCIISIELEHSKEHWLRSSIQREKNMENSNLYRSTDRGRNPIWLLSHYITLFCHQIKFCKKRGKRGKGIKKTRSGMPGNYSE
jgi:hypothetical protein